MRLSGLDFAMGVGTDVLAVAGGWITFADSVSDSRGPNVVTIDHGDGFMTQYWHMSNITPAFKGIHPNDPSAKPSVWVAQGTVVGQSGIGDGHPHLHLEMRYYRNPNLPKYQRDASFGVPYPAHGVPLGPYTVRSELKQSTKDGLNYNGNLTLGSESTVNGTDCNQSINVTNWKGSNGTLTASANNPPAVTGSTNTPPTSSPSIIVQQAWTTDQNGNMKTSFNPGDQVLFWATINNTTGTTVTSNYLWQATGPRQIMNLSGSLSVPPGTSNFATTTPLTVPPDGWNGHYSFRPLMTYNSLSSGIASDFMLTASPSIAYIVLTWPGFRSDLDSHLWLPVATPYHVWYQDLGNLNISPNAPSASLDKDDTSVSGMETIGISHFLPGTYYYAVYNFGNTGTLSGSYIGVRMYQNGVMTKELQSPSTGGTGRWWNVFKIVVDSNGNPTVQLINQITTTCPAPSPYICTSAQESSKPTQPSPTFGIKHIP